jgi:protein-disulfide isomerase
MNYNNCLKLGKTLSVGGLLLLLAACGGDDNTKTDETAMADAAPASEATTNVSSSDAVPQGDGTYGDIVYGDPSAAIEIIEYASLTCPHCATFGAQVFPKIKEKYIDSGKVKFIYRNFIMNRYDMAASVVARCKSPEVTKRLMKVFFERQSDWSRAEDPLATLANLARRAGGISRTEFDRCLANSEMQTHLVKMGQDGEKEFSITGTPTIILNGDKVDNYSWENLQVLIDAEL